MKEIVVNSNEAGQRMDKLLAKVFHQCSKSFLYKMKVHKDDAKRFKDDVEKIVSSSGEKWKGEYRLKNIYGQACLILRENHYAFGLKFSQLFYLHSL